MKENKESSYVDTCGKNVPQTRNSIPDAKSILANLKNNAISEAEEGVKKRWFQRGNRRGKDNKGDLKKGSTWVFSLSETGNQRRVLSRDIT